MKIPMAWPHLGASDSVGLGWGSRICISIRFPDVADALGQGTVFENHWSRIIIKLNLHIYVGFLQHPRCFSIFPRSILAAVC